MTTVCHGVKRFPSRAESFRTPGGPFLSPLKRSSALTTNVQGEHTSEDTMTRRKPQRRLVLFGIGKMVFPEHGLS